MSINQPRDFISTLIKHNLMANLPKIPNIGIFIENQFVMSKNTSITLGSYKNTSQVIGVRLRLLEEKQKIIVLRHAIEEGVNSGIAEDFNPEEHLKALKAKSK